MRADSPITTVADLKGKSIAVGKGSSAHGHILAQLQKAGLSPADVKLVFLQPADALSAFTSGQADAWAIWDPYTAQVEQQVPVRSIAQATVSPTEPGSASHRIRPGRPEAQHRAQRSAGALREGDQVGAGPSRGVGAAAIGGGGPGPAGRGAVAQSRSLRGSTALSDELIGSEQKLADLFAETKQIDSAPKFADWVDHRYDDALKPLLTNGN